MDSTNSRSPKGGLPSASRYELLQEIGVGSYGTVYRGIDSSTGKQVAIKEVDLDDVDDDFEEIQSEITVLQACRSPNIVQYYGSSIVQGTTKLRIAMELMDASVADLVSTARGGTPLSEPCIAYILREILNALVYLHSEHRMHRDIKAANVLLSVQGMVKVSDFGVAAQVGAATGAKRRTFVGSPLWMAPEVIQQSPDLVGISDDGGGEGKEISGGVEERVDQKISTPTRKSFEDDGYDEAADIWSLGITAIEMARGQPPRNGVPSFRLLFLIVREPPPSLEGDLSADFKDFVWQCLRKYPKDRPAAIDLLMHPFVAMAEMPQELTQRISNFISQRSMAHEESQHVLNQQVDNNDNDTAAWDFGTVKAALPRSTAAPPTETARPLAMLPPREESLSFGTVVVRNEEDIQKIQSHIGVEDEEPLNFGTVVSRVPPPQKQQQQQQQPVPPTRLQIPEPPSYGGDRRAGSLVLLSGTASTKPSHDIAASPMGFLPRPGGQPSPAAAGGGGGGRQSRIAVNGGGPKTKESVIDALTGMIESLQYSKNSPAIDELRNAATANLAELKSSGGGGSGSTTSSSTVDLGPLGNYLVGQWSV